MIDKSQSKLIELERRNQNQRLRQRNERKTASPPGKRVTKS